MSGATPWPPAQYLDIGDRIRIRHGGRSIPALIGHVGTVVEVFRIPLGSCLVRIDGDPNRLREWFFYRDELVINEEGGLLWHSP